MRETIEDTLLLSAFPGCGKTTYFNQNKGKLERSILDSDSSKFGGSQFPENYIEHIKKNLGKVSVIMISSHKTVRDALVENGLDFTLVYPDKSLKDEYVARYKARGSSSLFVETIEGNWDFWVTECEEQEGCKHIVLLSMTFIADIL